MKSVLLAASIAFAGSSLGCVTINVYPGANPPVTVGQGPDQAPAQAPGWGTPSSSYGYAAPPPNWAPPSNGARPIGGELWPNASAAPPNAAHGPYPTKPVDPAAIQ
jgi:hypothetical protein